MNSLKRFNLSGIVNERLSKERLRVLWGENKPGLLLGAIAALCFAAWAAFKQLSYPVIPEGLEWIDPPPEYISETSLFMACCFAILLGLGLWRCFRHFELKLHRRQLLVLGAGLMLGMAVRYCLLPEVTHDYKGFLYAWAERFRNEGWDAIKNTGDYTMPYRYFVFLITRLPVDPLYLYKLGSVVFDVLAVMAALRLSGRFNAGPWRKTILALAVFFTPTVLLNGAYWAQCDVIYAFFCLMCLIYALEERPVLSVIMAGLAVCIKLQTVFFLPMLAIFWIAKKVKLKHFVILPAVYLAVNLPAMLSGVPLFELGRDYEGKTRIGGLIGIYTGQAGQYSGKLSSGAPSMFELIDWQEANRDTMPDEQYRAVAKKNAALSRMGIGLAAGFILILVTLAWFKRKSMSDKALLLLSACMVLGIPWLLPSMHGRYFFTADMLCVIIAVLFPVYAYIGPLQVFASYGAYYNYLRHFGYLYGQYLPAPHLPIQTFALHRHSYAVLIVLIAVMVMACREIVILKPQGKPKGRSQLPRRKNIPKKLSGGNKR